MDARSLRSELMTKNDYMKMYKDGLHKIAMSDTLIDVDHYSEAATEAAAILSINNMITDKEYADMLQTIRMFVWHKNKKILEDNE